MSLNDVISEVESAQKAFSDAQTLTTSDQGVVDSAQAKLDAAKAVVASDQVAQADAAKAFNSALDDLIAAANAAKV